MNPNPSDGLFPRLHGRPAQTMIIAGLVFVLGAPLIPAFRFAEVNQAQADYNQVDQLMELDMEDLKRDQERARKQEQEEIQREMSEPVDDSNMDSEAIERRDEERRKRDLERQTRESERQKAFDDKREELKKKYDSLERKRALLNAQRAVAGMRWHRVLSFLGNVLLVLGLLVLTLESDGVRQKIALVILLVVMFSALAGVNLNFLAAGSMGDQSQGIERMLKGSP